MKQRKSIIVLLLVAIIGIIGLTVAYFASSTSVENEFQTSEYGADAIETFTSPTGWQPGDETPKVLTVKNTGSVDEAVRVKVEESWKSKNNTDLPLKQGNNVAAIINWTNTNDWTKVDVANEDYYYYYYNYKLAPDEVTSELLDKVTFNPLIDASTTCTETIENGVLTKSCKSNGAGYDGATYTLKFTIETVQYNKYAEAWGTGNTVTILAEKPKTAVENLLLKVNDASITNYNDGDPHEMYTFNHGETVQTPELIDYRYIGNDPYNYIKFNCNSDGENCEIWRIIGIFSVERPDPEDNTKTITEQRIKITRGSSLSSTMAYGSSNWPDASLKNYLNSTFLNSINEPYRNLIDNSKYYLGGIMSSSDNFYLSGDVLYSFERGNPAYDSNASNWVGKVAILYPSDQYYVYTKGVNAKCSLDAKKCGEEDARSGWIRVSNNLENGGLTYTWLLSPLYSSNYTYYISRERDSFDNVWYGADHAVRPTLYLKASAKIKSGTGEATNPYVLDLE